MRMRVYKNEIKAVLDKDAQYREMLFRRGYLLTDDELDLDSFPFYGIWSKVQLGKYYLLVHEKQTAFFFMKRIFILQLLDMHTIHS